MLRSVAMLSLLLGAASTAAAQEPTEEQISEARGHFERGTLAFERGDYGEAANEFEAAHLLTHHADLLYNMYTAHERNGEFESAATALEGYLRDGAPTEARREALDLRLERLRSRIAEAEAVAAQEAARLERERLDAEVRLREAEVERQAAEQRATEERAARMAQVQSGHSTADALDSLAIVSLIGATAGAVSFAVFAGLSEGEDQSVAARCGRDAGMLCREEDVSTLRAFNIGADASLGAASGLGIIGGALLLIALGLRPSDHTQQAWAVPIVGPGRAGLGGGVSW